MTIDLVALTDRAEGEPALSGAWRWFLELWEVERRNLVALGRELDLSPPQVWALRHLQPGSARPMGELAPYLVCDNSNLTGIIGRLERRGLVERRQSSRDRRVKMLVLTPAGERVREAIVRRMCEPIRGMDTLSAEECDQLLALLAKAGEAVLAADPLEATAGITR